MLPQYRELATFIAGELGISSDDLFRKNKTRKRHIVEIRYAIILFIDTNFSAYKIDIGPLFGYPDHSMASIAVSTAKIWCENDKKFLKLYNKIEELSVIYEKTI